MIQTKTLFYSIILILVSSASFAQQLDSSYTNQNTIDNTVASLNDLKEEIGDSLHANVPLYLDTTFHKQNLAVYPPTSRDYRRLGYNTAIYLGATVVAFGVLYALPESVTNWDKQDMKENGILNKWKKNVEAGPVMDEDDWFLNWVTHPYSGAVYYMTARSSGFNMFESFVYSALMSTFFWEYGIEAFAEIPSIQDLIITPVVGSVMGEGFFLAKKSILKHDKRVLKSRFLGNTTLLLIDPFNTILDGFGYKERTKTQLNITPIGFDTSSNKPIWGLNFSAQF